VSPDIGVFADSIEAVGDKAGVFELAEWAEGWAQSRGLPPDAVFAMRICVEEAVTNIANYAFDGAYGPGTIALTATPLPNGVRVTVADRGRPFDVAAAEDPGREGDIQSATIGGRGIRLMRRFSDTLEYARVGDQNRLTLTFFTDKPAPGR
jgi:anti-sigma regulatory factor (Ser/Thr protein kinase)